MQPRIDGTMQATPRNALLGYIADALNAANNYANKPNPSMPMGKANPPLSLLASALGIGDLGATADNLSYGRNLTQGQGMARQMRPETANALLTAGPLAAKFPKQAAAVTAGLLSGDTAAARAMFIGPAAKTWDAAAAAKAAALEAQGKDARAIWQETGTFKGADGKWRQEIPDRAAFRPEIGLIDGDTTYRTMSGSLNHPAMFKAYPEVRDMDTVVSRLPNTTGGSYQEAVPGTKTEFGRSAQIDATGKDREDIKSVLLHEMQHYIQKQEGFASGGSPSMFDPKAAERARDILNWRTELENYMANKGFNPKTNSDAWMNAENALIQEYAGIGAMDMLPSREVRTAAAQPWYRQGDSGRKNLEKMVQEYGLDKAVTPRTSFDMYRSLAGEAEARATQARMNMNAQQRRQTFPLDSYDVPIGSLIVR